MNDWDIPVQVSLVKTVYFLLQDKRHEVGRVETTRAAGGVTSGASDVDETPGTAPWTDSESRTVKTST